MLRFFAICLDMSICDNSALACHHAENFTKYSVVLSVNAPPCLTLLGCGTLCDNWKRHEQPEDQHDLQTRLWEGQHPMGPCKTFSYNNQPVARSLLYVRREG